MNGLYALKPWYTRRLRVFVDRAAAQGTSPDAFTLIGIAGAGSIGCFVGGMLASGGRRVALLARPRVIAASARRDIDCRLRAAC